jgi:hypothetical protein
MIKTIKEHMVQNILSMILGVLSYLILSVYTEVIPSILPMLQGLPNTTILKIGIAAIILFALSVVLSIVIYLKYKPKFTTKFGVSWGKDKEAYCPSCQVPLSDYREQKRESGITSYIFHCFKCDKIIPLTHNGSPLKLDEARKML